MTNTLIKITHIFFLSFSNNLFILNEKDHSNKLKYILLNLQIVLALEVNLIKWRIFQMKFCRYT